MKKIENRTVRNTRFIVLSFLFARYHIVETKHVAFGRDILEKIKKEIIRPEESTVRKAFSIGFGSFMAFTPIWGFQMAASLPIAIFLRLNKVLVLLFANLSIAPLLPLIIYYSFKIGGLFTTSNEVELLDWRAYSLDTIQQNVIQYATGSMILATTIGSIAFATSYAIIGMIKGDDKDN